MAVYDFNFDNVPQGWLDALPVNYTSKNGIEYNYVGQKLIGVESPTLGYVRYQDSTLSGRSDTGHLVDIQIRDHTRSLLDYDRAIGYHVFIDGRPLSKDRSMLPYEFSTLREAIDRAEFIVLSL